MRVVLAQDQKHPNNRWCVDQKRSQRVRSVESFGKLLLNCKNGAESGSTYLKHISLAGWQLILAGSKTLPVWTPASHLCTVNLIPCKQHTQSPTGGCMAANLHGNLHTGVWHDEMTIQMLSMTCLVV